jgi:hypothetical protein
LRHAGQDVQLFAGLTRNAQEAPKHCIFSRRKKMRGESYLDAGNANNRYCSAENCSLRPHLTLRLFRCLYQGAWAMAFLRHLFKCAEAYDLHGIV